jgi:formylglycine-generating enzyme required for sulfatase activity
MKRQEQEVVIPSVVRSAVLGKPKVYQERVVALLEAELTRPPPQPHHERGLLMRRQGNAVAALFALRRTDNVRPELLAELILSRGYVGTHTIDRLLAGQPWTYRDGVVALVEREFTRKLPPGAKEEERAASAQRRQHAVSALLELHRSESIHPELLLALITEQGLLAHLVEKICSQRPREYSARVLTLLKAELTRKPSARAGEDERKALVQGQCHAAAALVALGKEEWVWPSFGRDADPDLRTGLVHTLSGDERWTKAVLDRLERETDDFARRALLLLLCEEQGLAMGWPAELTARLTARYRDDPDPGVHSILDWGLRRVPQGAAALAKLDLELASRGPVGKRRWYVNGQGHTLAVIPGPVEFWMGSPEDEPARRKEETRHRRRIPRAYAVATREVTLEQFDRFLKDHPAITRNLPGESDPELEKAVPGGAVYAVTWYEAAQYCRWLSEREQVPEDQMCYPPVAEIEKARQAGEGLKLPADYLTRTGYRLPTEAEWEYACRAGRGTSRFWGSSLAWKDKYARSERNAFVDEHGTVWLPVGLLMPNDLGLFDMLGNVAEWCQDRLQTYPSGPLDQAHEDREDAAPVPAGALRVLRGGAFNSPEGDIRAASRVGRAPTAREPTIGFRVARTCR